jgi:hypothetical protein
MQHFWSRSHWNFLPPASQRGKKVILIPPPISKVTFSIYLIPRRNVWEISCLRYTFNLRNFARFHPKNAWNRISGTLDFKIFPGVYAPVPPRHSHAFGVRFAPQKRKVFWLRHCKQIRLIVIFNFEFKTYTVQTSIRPYSVNTHCRYIFYIERKSID